MYTLLDSCLDRLDIFEFLNHVEDGLKDHYDIKMLTYLMLVRLAHLCPSAVLQSKSVAQKLITKLSGAKRSPGNPNVMFTVSGDLAKQERKGLYSIDAILENTILPFTLLEKSNAFDIKFHILILKS